MINSHLYSLFCHLFQVKGVTSGHFLPPFRVAIIVTDWNNVFHAGQVVSISLILIHVYEFKIFFFTGFGI